MLAPNATLRSQIVPGEANPETDIANQADEPPLASPQARISWAQLLTRVFAIDITTCPQCGGALTILAALEDPAVIGKILAHLELPTSPPRSPAQAFDLFQTARSHPRSGSLPEPTIPLAFTHLTPPPFETPVWRG